MITLLITGGCGFIGSNFINYIFDKNQYNIINIDAMYYCANENNIKDEIRKSPNYQLVVGNICDSNLINYILNKNNITHIIHFAAQSHVDNSFENSLQYTQDNILGTHTLLECCRKYGKIARFIHVSTDEVYGESMLEEDEQHKTEHSVLCPSNPYAATKAGAELIAQAYYHSYKMPIIITRGNNVYGPNQYPEKLIPKFIKLLKENKKVTIQGDGSCVRAFLHAKDTARAFEVILEKGEVGEIYNIGCNEGMEFSVLEVAKMLIKIIKGFEDYDKWIEYVKDRPFNDKRYYISNQKLKNLGWDIKVEFIDGLSKLIYDVQHDVILEPHLTEKDKILFYKYLDNSKNYFEFGAGGSTYKAVNTKNILKICSVESDIEWYNIVSKINKNDKEFIIKLIDLKCKSNTFGHPGVNSDKENWKKYSNSIIDIGIDSSNKIDFILIDGRFRVACCLKCHNVINDNCLIAFDDFLDRDYYNIVLDYYEIVETMNDKMVILKKKNDIFVSEELIKIYELNAQ
jgi:UDP-glucose 4,6-dehydratase